MKRWRHPANYKTIRPVISSSALNPVLQSGIGVLAVAYLEIDTMSIPNSVFRGIFGFDNIVFRHVLEI